MINQDQNTSTENPTCCICLQHLDNVGIKKIRCGHEFHRNCIQEWTKRRPSCPICRSYTPNSTPSRTQQYNRNLYLRRYTISPIENQWNNDRINLNGVIDQRGVNIIDLAGENLSIREILIFIIIILICMILLILYNSTMKSCLCDKKWEPNQTHKVEYHWWFSSSTTFIRPAICCYIC